MSELVFLKLGGSLITDKTRPYTPRLDKLADLAAQIVAVLSGASTRPRRALHQDLGETSASSVEPLGRAAQPRRSAKARSSRSAPGLRLILGHGSGSFGHTAAKQHNTRAGVHDAEGWRGFAEVWFQASALNRLVMEALYTADVPAVAFPPSVMVTARDGQVETWDLKPLRSALEARLLPVIYGDVIFDTARGGTILSTEDLMCHLARQLHPVRILLAGLEPGVWADFPARTRLVEEITPRSFSELRSALGGAAGADVTGGMMSKVQQMLNLVQEIPGLQVRIFCGEEKGAIERALRGEALGTLITS